MWGFVWVFEEWETAEEERKTSETIEISEVFLGAAIQIRTGDLILTKDALYLLSYSSMSLTALIL